MREPSQDKRIFDNNLRHVQLRTETEGMHVMRRDCVKTEGGFQAWTRRIAQAEYESGSFEGPSFSSATPCLLPFRAISVDLPCRWCRRNRGPRHECARLGGKKHTQQTSATTMFFNRRQKNGILTKCLHTYKKVTALRQGKANAPTK